MDIRILPSNIANMIAAGEVVQRPASAVKELMENAVDAGATQITVILTDSGRTLIQVIDNGCGMSPDQAVLCFERHATSKIATAEDLNDITTFGFRGEALASIAAVAEVTLKTRRDGDEVGCQVEFADSKHISTEEISTPVGSNFSVRNLFYNVPARRKFMKSDNVELRHVIEEFTRVALTRPEIGFRLMNNGKDIHVLKPAKLLKYRIQDLLGSSVVSQVVLRQRQIFQESVFPQGRDERLRKYAPSGHHAVIFHLHGSGSALHRREYPSDENRSEIRRRQRSFPSVVRLRERIPRTQLLRRQH